MLRKYVLVSNYSDTWFDMFDSAHAAAESASRNQGTHVETWDYPERPDGTHGTPFKHKPKSVEATA